LLWFLLLGVTFNAVIDPFALCAMTDPVTQTKEIPVVLHEVRKESKECEEKDWRLKTDGVDVDAMEIFW
jgi:hypothetical protein